MTAWREYANSQEYRDGRDPETLGRSNRVRRTFLENRLRNAFDAGWNAANTNRDVCDSSGVGPGAERNPAATVTAAPESGNRASSFGDTSK